ncbi:outer membrane protein [Devosia sp. ZW T5_3]|uniref:outer membrane protein n=1 Tax=Devosia sp. ZW T5_3 TaxID=3378085 RepID=UPI00385545B3
MFVRSLSLGVAAAALLVGGAQAADLIIPTTPAPIYEAAGFSWDGLYAGVQGGGEFWDGDTYGILGAHVGVNFIVADPILLGLEGTAEYVWNDDIDSAEFFINGRVGAIVTDSVLVYALVGAGVENIDGRGVGIDDNQGVYQLGAGVELAVTDSVTVRGQVVGYGYFDDAVGNDFFDAAKATVGVSYHF